MSPLDYIEEAKVEITKILSNLKRDLQECETEDGAILAHTRYIINTYKSRKDFSDIGDILICYLQGKYPIEETKDRLDKIAISYARHSRESK